MYWEIIKGLLTPVLLITIGIYLKVTSNPRFQEVKGRWKFLFWIGVALLILKTINMTAHG